LLYLLTTLVFLLYLVLVWFLGQWLHLEGANLLILRVGLAAIGLLGAIVFVWFYRKIKAAKEGTEATSVSSASSEIEAILREANRRLKSSVVAGGARLGNLPLIFVLGEPDSTKTTTVIHSALDPELLSGQVYQDNQVLPTRVLNVWYSRQAVMIDPAGRLMTQAADWKHLLKRLQPIRFSVFRQRHLAPRAAVVCFDCEAFLKPGASETTLSAARRLGARLQEISYASGISFPVYVLFTKMDRVSFFTEFMRGLTRDEASEVLGATLAVRSLAMGVYAEEETRRLTKAFDELFYSLAEKRLDLLAREHESDKLPGIYEFPRELRKVRTLLVQFLVDLARPSQLNVNPFLRGFYFCGVRPVVIEEVAARAEDYAQAGAVSFDAGATRIFTGFGASMASAPAPMPFATSRKVPHWTFLTQLFNEVIVKDRVALAASRVSSRVNLLRRILLAGTTAIATICIAGFAISFARNHALKSELRAAVADLQSVPAGASPQPSFTDLQKLDRLRLDLVKILSYRHDGVPWGMRWGLYVGNDIYADAKKSYFLRFQQLLFADAQGRLLSDLRALPEKPEANDSYESNYNKLRAYLITTSNHDKSTREFLSPILLSAWLKIRPVDPDRATLAGRQFDFYSTDLITENPFSTANDLSAIAQARRFLSQFAGVDRYYLPLLAKASAKNPDISFGDQFRDAAGVVISSHKVRGAFTRAAFQYMQEAIDNPSQIAGEEWVLGKATASELDPLTLQQNLRQRYAEDFVNEWRMVLQSSSVVPYHDYKDADKKLEALTSQTSPLLELLWFISHNTDVHLPSITDIFQPVQAIEPPGDPDKSPDQYILPSNKEYIYALAKLQSDISPLAHTANSADPDVIKQASSSAGAARATIPVVMGARVDQRFHSEAQVRTLLEQPIRNAEALFARAPKDQANGAGHDLCPQFNAMVNKYPFNPSSTTEVSVDELNSLLAPNKGALWAIYNSRLAQLIVKEGSRYTSAPGANLRVSQTFLNFFNRAAQLSDALYANGSASPRFTYTLKQSLSNVPDGLVLRIGTETLSGTGQQKTFVWTGNPEEVVVSTTKGAILNSFSGTWAAFRFVGDARPRVYASFIDLEWVQESNGHPIMLGDKPESYNYQLQLSGFNPFRASELSGLRCVSTVVSESGM